MKPRLERLEVLRALACIGVFTSHCYISSLGAWGVSVFIMLSGFLLVYNGLDRADSFPTGAKGCAGYAFRKIARLYPLYIFGLVLMVALSLGKYPIRRLLKPRYFWVPLVRNLLLPALVLGLSLLVGLEKELTQVVVMFVALPVASLIAAFTIQYDSNEETQFEAAAAVLLSTIFAAVTIPLWASVLALCFP